ncbi:surface lipoprotein assembly modifier [Thiopseudomonas denitrificans]|uniref:Uncharacterized protein DUF560 n=1 Tax=Thiopseudomonas denitrificans TaxID=1501432 RepID=A0A4R6TS95_9GAMM|nr:porin family protein [Thiopseudomonas denitrificans]TDQ36488.1 uncharacterized protein DUF560 [Thiopseudomonas denitrificans]
MPHLSFCESRGRVKNSFFTLPLLSALLLCLLTIPKAQANDDDTRFIQDQTRRSIQQQSQAEQELAAPPGTLMYEGQRYQVASTLESLTPAIYVAINTSQWSQLPEFVERYRALPGHRPALANMADSLYARFLGKYPQALRLMEQASEQEPQDARIQLELARLWFEDHQERRAAKGFARVLGMGLPEQAQMLVAQYQQAMAIRDRWHGSAALGWGRNDNINQANGYYSCLSSFAGICLFERQMPEPIASRMNNYELSLQRRFNLAGNHNLHLQPMSYGSYYSKTNDAPNASLKDYSTNLAIVQAGYQYLDVRNSLTLLPYVEHYYRNRASEYMAHGLQLEARRSLSQKWQIGTSLDSKRYEYTRKGKQLGANYAMHQWGLNLSYSPRANTSLYGGVTASRHKYEVDQASSKDWSARVGVYQGFAGRAGLFVNALAIYRETRHDAYDFFLGEQRRDRQQLYILSAGANGWQLAGLTPEIRVRHNINRSNIGWAFDFEQTEVSLMLRKSF